MSPAKRNQAGRLPPRESIAYAVLGLFLVASGWFAMHGRIIAAWAIGAVGFSIAAAIAGHDVDQDSDSPP